MRRSSLTIRSVSEADWPDVRAIRLEMLADFPIAYGETLAHATTVAEPEWRMRARRGQEPRQAAFVAIDDATMRWAGVMNGYIPPSGVALLVGVYVAPDFRGREVGVADRLLATVEDWAREFGNVIELDVHEDNPRAIRFYERNGFVDTGRRLTYDLEPGGHEWRMAKAL